MSQGHVLAFSASAHPFPLRQSQKPKKFGLKQLCLIICVGKPPPPPLLLLGIACENNAVCCFQDFFFCRPPEHELGHVSGGGVVRMWLFKYGTPMATLLYAWK